MERWKQLPIREVVRMYVKDRMSLRAVGEVAGASHQHIATLLREAGISPTRRSRSPYKKTDPAELQRLYVDEGKTIAEIATILKLSPSKISKDLRALDITILRGGTRSIVFPELRKLEVGESLELPRIRSATKHTYTRYYMMAKNFGIKVSVRVIDDDKVRVTRKE